MKKIIFIHLLNDYSGSPKVLSQVINTCKEDGYELELFTCKSSTGFLTGVTKNLHYYFYKHFKNKYLTLFSFLISQLILAIKLLKYFNKDVVFYINTMLPFGAALAGKLMNKPVYYHIHETSIKPKLLKRFLRFIIQITANKIIFVSKSLKQAESFNICNQSVIYNALPKTVTNKILQHRYKPFDSKGVFNVYMICSLRAYKGVNEFIEIAKCFELNKLITFTLILNVQQKEIDNYFNTLEIPSNVNLISRQINLIPFYKKASLVLNLSLIDQWIETFGLTILEAMAFGVPVIVPPVGGPTEIVTDGVEGYLMSSYKIEEIVKKIKELSKNSTKCMELSQNARKRSLYFNEETFKKKILKVLNA